MSTALKDILKRNRDRKSFVAAGNDVNDFRETPPVQELPKPKALNTKAGEPDQCFVMIPDVHSFDRDKVAFDLMMEALPILNEDFNVTKFVQLGDLLECRSISSHPASNVLEPVPQYTEEISWAVEEFWKPAINALPNANFYSLMGNHEERLNKWVAAKIGRSDLAVQIYNDFMPTKLYEEMGIHVTAHGRADINEGVLELFPGLVCVHGWSTAVNAPKAHLAKLMGGRSMLFGHTHRMQSDVQRDPLTNDYIRSYSFGSLAQVSMHWHRGQPMNHTLGFGLVFTHGDKFFVKTVDILMDGDKRILMLPNGQVLER
jgi:hypothetical protein